MLLKFLKILNTSITLLTKDVQENMKDLDEINIELDLKNELRKNGINYLHQLNELTPELLYKSKINPYYYPQIKQFQH